MPDRRLNDFGARRRLIVELDALNPVAAVDDFVRGNDDLPNVGVGLAEMLVEIFNAVAQPLHIADQMSDLGKNLVGSLTHFGVLANLLDHLDGQHQE